MKKLASGLITLILLSFPQFGQAAINSSINASGLYTTSTDSQFDVTLNNYAESSAISLLTLADSNANDLKSASFLDKSGWVRLTPYQSGSDVLAKFISDTGFNVNGSRVITVRLNFNTPKTYILGFSLLDATGQTISSAAAPVTVNGPKVLGATTNAAFQRTLSYGSTGADVTALQNRLTAEGVYTGPVTGFFGVLTQAGVKRYQAKYGITANGVVGPQTLSALNQ